MKNHKMNLLLIFTVFFSVSYLFTIIDVDAVGMVAETLSPSSRRSTSTQCKYVYGTGTTGDLSTALGFWYSIDIDNRKLTISIGRGKHRINSYNTDFLENPSGTVISNDSPVTYDIKSGLDLIHGDSPYESQFTFSVLEQPSDCSIYGTFGFRVVLNPSGLPSSYTLGDRYISNSNYNKEFCRITREQSTKAQVDSVFGDSGATSIGAKYESNINKSSWAAASSYYKKIISNACDATVDRFNAIEESDAKELVKRAISLYYNASKVEEFNKQWDDQKVSDKCNNATEHLVYQGSGDDIDVKTNKNSRGGLIDGNSGAFKNASGVGNFCNINLPNNAAYSSLTGGLGGSVDFSDYTDPASAFTGLTCRATCNASGDCSNLAEHLSDGSYNIKANHTVVRTIVQVNQYWATYSYADACEPNPATERKVACRRICEEYVEAYYGPPIAATAGLCFEYQVRVTSHVQCRTEINSDGYPRKVQVCIPYPVCSNSSGWSGDQAGPTTEFDNCIKSCDGGKYTKECSNECYKKVYANKQFSITKNAVNSNLTGATKMENSIGNGRFNCTPAWEGGGCASYYSAANRTGDSRSASAQLASGSYTCQDGFLKHKDADGHVCEDSCTWYHSCSGMKYVNAEDSSANYAANMEKFDEAVAQCSEDAKCSSSSATFKISVDYTNGKGKKVTIDYPYTTSGEAYDILASEETEDKRKSKVQVGLSGQKFISNAAEDEGWRNEYQVNGWEHTLLSYDGCYANAADNRYYMGHWSFHGYWVSNKGAISLKRPADTRGWTLRPDKFCLPFDAQDVNQSWWDYYHTMKEGGSISTSDSVENINDICCIKKMYEKGQSAVGSSIDYNIRAVTTNFGYFGTPVKVSCFYALHDKKEEYGCVDDRCGIGATTDYKIRPVELTDMFPTTDGTKHESKTYGRVPGFNWSQFAINELKDTAFQSNPPKYVDKVQKLGYGVYDEDYLDYSFILKRDDLRKINNAAKREFKHLDVNETVDTGMVADNGLYHYRSKLFRNGGIISASEGGGNPKDSNVIPNEDVLHCNNIQNYAATICDTSAVGGV